MDEAAGGGYGHPRARPRRLGAWWQQWQTLVNIWASLSGLEGSPPAGNPSHGGDPAANSCVHVLTPASSAAKIKPGLTRFAADPRQGRLNRLCSGSHSNYKRWEWGSGVWEVFGLSLYVITVTGS